MTTNDLDHLARAYPEAPEWAGSGEVDFQGKVVFQHFDVNHMGFSIDEIRDRYHELSGKPKAWVNDWARFRAQDACGEWYEFDFKPVVKGHHSDVWDIYDKESDPSLVGCGELIGDWRDTLEQREVEKKGMEDLLNELYQVLGDLDAPEKVLDQVFAAAEGVELPYDTLLPFVKEQPKWNGPEDGLPPLGMELDGGKTFCGQGVVKWWNRPVWKVVGHHTNGKTFFVEGIKSGMVQQFHIPTDQPQFRPVRTDRERTIESIDALVVEWFKGKYGVMECGEYLYDAGLRFEETD